MQTITICVGIPASGKSTWAKEVIKKDPFNTVRINRDSLRDMATNYIWSQDNENLIISVRNFMITRSLKSKRNIIIDDCNISKRSFNDIVNVAKSAEVNCIVIEKPFYIELDEAIKRNALREGTAKIPEEAIRRMWKDSGGVQHKFYKPRTEIISSKIYESIIQNTSLPKAAIFDNDGTISLVHPNRNPYDASTCDKDLPHLHVIEAMNLYYNAGYKIIFVSGREEKDKEPTEKFYKTYFPNVKYELFMRKTGDKRKDVIVKEEIFNQYIKDKYNVCAWFDDRLQVCEWIFKSGLPLFRVNNPCSNF
jgi:predicted kinase